MAVSGASRKKQILAVIDASIPPLSENTMKTSLIRTLAAAMALLAPTAAFAQVTTGPATWLTSTNTTLTGTVNPNGLATTARFEYGLTTDYGFTKTVTLSPNNGSTDQAVSVSLGTLPAGTTYHYRLTATNNGGTFLGDDHTFVTTRTSGDFSYTTADDTATITGWTGTGGAVTIPSMLNGLTVTGIGYQAFYSKTIMTSVSIPSSVTSIGVSTFTYCSGLTSLTIPSSVTSIGDSSFENCHGLTNVTITSNLTSIGNFAFFYCTKLLSIQVDAANPNYSSLEGVLFDKDLSTLIQYPGGKSGSYTIPEGVSSIGRSAFFGCAGLTSVTIPESVTSIGSSDKVSSIGGSGFSNCTKLIAIQVNAANPNYSSFDGVLFNKALSILIQWPGGKSGFCTIPSSVTSIGGYAFYNCTRLTGTTIPSSVTSIGLYAFFGCRSLTSVLIPANVTNIGYGAFRYCSALTTITIPSSVTSIEDYAFSYCSSLMAVTIPHSVTSIGRGAFSDCSGLTRVTIPSSVTSIGNAAFYGCRGLTNVAIPDSVISISASAFSYCTGLMSAQFTGNAPAMQSSVFSNAGSGFSVYYFNDSIGFTSPTWNGYPSVNMGDRTQLSTWLIDKGFPYNADLQEDANHDGVNLLLAYALGLEPDDNLAGSLPQPVIGPGGLSISFHASAPDVIYVVESSTDLVNWNSSGVVLGAPDGDGIRTATVAADGPHRYLRLAVSH